MDELLLAKIMPPQQKELGLKPATQPHDLYRNLML